MDIKPIHTESDYSDVLREVAASFDSVPQPGSPEGNRFEILIMLIEAYEAQHYAITPPDSQSMQSSLQVLL